MSSSSNMIVMARTSGGKSTWLWAGTAGVAVLGLGAAAFAVSRRRSGNEGLPGGSTGSGAGAGKPKAPADPRAADAAFAATTGAAAAAAVVLFPATAPYVGAATPVVAAAWQSQPPAARAGIFSPEVAAAAQVAAPVAAGAAAPTPAPEPSGRREPAFAGWAFGAAPKFAKSGPGAVFKWSVDRFVKELKKAMANLRAQFCGAANKVYKALKDKGAAVPSQKKWDDLSCDQRIAFVAALGPQGVALLAAGALVGGFARDAAGEFKKYGGRAADAVATLSKKLGLKVPDVGGSASSAAKSIAKSVGIGAFDDCSGCGGGRGEPLPGANLPGTTFVTPAGHPPRVYAANVRTRDVSPVKLGIL